MRYIVSISLASVQFLLLQCIITSSGFPSVATAGNVVPPTVSKNKTKRHENSQQVRIVEVKLRVYSKACLRGGARSLFPEDRGSNKESSDDSSSDEKDVDEEPDKDAMTAATTSTEPNTQDDQTQSYFLASILWLSLALDVVLNKKKRALLFPTATMAVTSGSATPLQFYTAFLNPTASLAAGFLLASGISFLLSRNDDSAEVLTSEPTNDDTIHQSSSRSRVQQVCNTTTTTTSRRVTKRLALLLASFGVLNLGANLNSSFTEAPFLGMGGMFINAYNSLIALNGWRKCITTTTSNVDANAFSWSWTTRPAILRRELTAFVSSLGLARSDEATSERISRSTHTRLLPQFISAVYLVAIWTTLLRIVDVIANQLVPYYRKWYTLGMVRGKDNERFFPFRTNRYGSWVVCAICVYIRLFVFPLLHAHGTWCLCVCLGCVVQSHCHDTNCSCRLAVQ